MRRVKERSEYKSRERGTGQTKKGKGERKEENAYSVCAREGEVGGRVRVREACKWERKGERE